MTVWYGYDYSHSTGFTRRHMFVQYCLCIAILYVVRTGYLNLSQRRNDRSTIIIWVFLAKKYSKCKVTYKLYV